MGDTWYAWAAFSSLGIVLSFCHILGVTVSACLSHSESSALVCFLFLTVENVCFGPSASLLALLPPSPASWGPAKAQGTTLDLVSLRSVHCVFQYFLKKLRVKPLFPIVDLSFNSYAYTCTLTKGETVLSISGLSIKI